MENSAFARERQTQRLARSFKHSSSNFYLHPLFTMGLLSPLYNLPNNVLEKQKLYQNSSKPIMTRGPRSGLYLGVYGALFVAGILSTTYAGVTLVKGKSE
ncbi:hypothetical protein BJ165DRAFT_1521164 [Panaeolus papilionaceus]|nr:hypothetical protein BJ165DRAFT_1521164 [Panaeolus papilionaceus]